MRILNHILHPVKKFSKGMLALLTMNFTLFACVFIFDACKKSNYEKSDSGKANAKFWSALELYKKDIGSTSFGKKFKNTTTTARSEYESSEYETIYIDFPNEVTTESFSMYQNTNSIQELTDLIHYTDATVQYEPTPENSNYQLEVPVEQVVNSLNPLVQESKQYLYSKGFTEQDIQQMIAEENAQEEDLIPLVMIITQAEKTQFSARNYMTLFPINTAYAKLDYSEVGSCALEAIGADFLWSAGAATGVSWTMAAIRTTFTNIAKRFLGPVGVAIAVVEFSWCLSRHLD